MRTRTLYLIAATLLLALLGLLQVATVAHSPVGSPTASSTLSGQDAHESNLLGASDGMR